MSESVMLRLVTFVAPEFVTVYWYGMVVPAPMSGGSGAARAVDLLLDLQRGQRIDGLDHARPGSGARRWIRPSTPRGRTCTSTGCSAGPATLSSVIHGPAGVYRTCTITCGFGFAGVSGSTTMLIVRSDAVSVVGAQLALPAVQRRAGCCRVGDGLRHRGAEQAVAVEPRSGPAQRDDVRCDRTRGGRGRALADRDSCVRAARRRPRSCRTRRGPPRGTRRRYRARCCAGRSRGCRRVRRSR